MNRKLILAIGIIYTFTTLINSCGLYMLISNKPVLKCAITKNDTGMLMTENSYSWIKNMDTKIKELKEKERQIQLEKEKKAKEEQKRLAMVQAEEKKANKIFTLTFYTDLAEENGGYSGITCTGSKLEYGMVANNVLPLNTIIKLEGMGEFKVADRGGSNFNNSNRLDVFVPRNKGESKSSYIKRVNKLGVKKVHGYIKK